jgi:hypothetical protein
MGVRRGVKHGFSEDNLSVQKKSAVIKAAETEGFKNFIL